MTNVQGSLDKEIFNLKNQLESTGISTSEWGKGSAKTLRHLAQEIASGETTLATGTDGQLLRQVVVAGADIYYKSEDGRVFRLIEDKQVFKDGRERRRKLGNAVSEKVRAGEDPAATICRGIIEELGIEGDVKAKSLGKEEEFIDSPSFPGLKGHFITHKFRVELSAAQYRPEGYIEVQSDKTTYFVWESFE